MAAVKKLSVWATIPAASAAPETCPLNQTPLRQKGNYMKYIIDRFEGGNAVCEKEDRTTILVERTLLPSQAGEGDVLIYEAGRYLLDSAATLERRKRMEEKRKKLFG